MYARAKKRRYARRRVFGVVVLLAVALISTLGALSACGALQRGEGAFSGQDGEPANAGNNGSGNGNRGNGNSGNANSNNGNSTGSNGSSSGGGNSGGPSEGRGEPVRAIYLTAQSINNLDAYLNLADRTDVNAFVIDVKDVTGEVMYPSEVPLANEVGATRDYLDLKPLLAELKKRDIYSIARVATFEDDILPVARPDLAATDSATGSQWRNNVGNYWSDPYNRQVWEYNAAIAKEVAEAGFDEVQFDYVRFPSDGPMERLTFPAQRDGDDGNPIARFLRYADGELEPSGVKISADVFGLAAGEDGAGVGQRVTLFAPYLDVISPMIYPSHYPVGSYGFENPNARPYEVVSESMREFQQASEKANPDLEIRPWLQDFDYGPPDYGPAEVEAQIRAVYDADETGWLLWNAGNVYTEAALENTESPDYGGR